MLPAFASALTLHAFACPPVPWKAARHLTGGKSSFHFARRTFPAPAALASRRTSAWTGICASAVSEALREVLVVGGGPGGLGAALELDRVLNGEVTSNPKPEPLNPHLLPTPDSKP